VVAIAVTAFVAVLAFVFDLGHMHTVRQELQNAAEAGALAGTRALFDLAGDSATKTTYPNCTRGVDHAQRAAKANMCDKKTGVAGGFNVAAQLIRWDWARNTIYPASPSCNLEPATGVNGVRVTASRTSAGSGGAVSLTFGKIFGKDTADVEVFAAAAVASGLPPGPANNIAVNSAELAKWKLMTPEEIKNQKIKMSPDGGDNAAWCAAAPYNPSAANLKDWIKDGTSPAIQGPPDGTVNLNNGNVTAALQALSDMLAKVIASPSVFEGGWLVYFPVVDNTKFVSSGKVVGFQAFIITGVEATGNPKGISFHLYTGDYLPPGMSLGSQGQAYLLPKLVQMTPATP